MCSLSLLALVLVGPMVSSQMSEADKLLSIYGKPSEFPLLYRESLEVFIGAEAAYKSKDYKKASSLLEAFWQKNPPATEAWAKAYREAHNIGLTKGINIGCPPAYYSLRMLTDCVRWRVAGGKQDSKPSVATFTAILVGQSKGIEPRTKAELAEGKGEVQTHTLHPALLADSSRIVREPFWLWGEYMLASTNGKLLTKVHIEYLKDLTVPVGASESQRRYACMVGEADALIWAAVPEKVKKSTDWWWILYPSHVPAQYPDFTTTEFITGGMGTGPDGVSPCFISDDRWLVKKPPHLGKGLMTDIERNAYLPQWFQHEFFHHLFRSYPEFGLEAKDHQWFDRKTWPAGFEGFIEPDYYYEAMHKMLKPKASPPMHVTMRYTPPPASLYKSLKLELLVGDYRHEPVENDWHIGRITIESVDSKRLLRWTNKAGKSWLLTPDLLKGELAIGTDCPYYSESASPFRVQFRRDSDGNYTPVLTGFVFNSAFYRRVGK